MSVGTRIRQIRKARGLTIIELATSVGSDVGNISRLERDKQGYSDDMLRRIAAELGVHVSEFFKDERADANVQLVELPRAMDVPLISWVQAGAWGEIVDNFAAGDAEEWMICPRRHGKHTFALKVRGVSMRPRYEDGDIIFVDPDAAADHGKNVVVRLENEKEATFKQLVIEDGRKFLRALNPEWTPRIMEINERATICGVVIGKWVPE